MKRKILIIFGVLTVVSMLLVNISLSKDKSGDNVSLRNLIFIANAAAEFPGDEGVCETNWTSDPPYNDGHGGYYTEWYASCSGTSGGCQSGAMTIYTIGNTSSTPCNEVNMNAHC